MIDSRALLSIEQELNAVVPPLNHYTTDSYCRGTSSAECLSCIHKMYCFPVGCIHVRGGTFVNTYVYKINIKIKQRGSFLNNHHFIIHSAHRLWQTQSNICSKADIFFGTDYFL